MFSVLLIDDSIDSQLIVRGAIGTDVDLVCAASVAEATKKLDSNFFHLILLDIFLPDSDGFKFCTQLKNNSKTKEIPVMMITGKDDIHSKVMGFSLGAEDYILKPFNPLELRARVMSKLVSAQKQRDREEVKYVDDFCINTSLQKAFRVKNGNNQDLHLSPAEYKLFLFLIRHRGKVLERDFLLTSIWGENCESVDRVVDRHISTLRKKLGSFGKRIQTLSRVGYGLDVQPRSSRNRN